MTELLQFFTVVFEKGTSGCIGITSSISLSKVSDVSRKPFCFRFFFSYYSLFFIKVSDFSRKPFCFRFVFSYYSLLRFPTLVGNLSVFVLSFLIILYSLFFILYFSSLFSTSLSIHNFVNFQPIDLKFSTSV